jgi:hypothetical protein
MLKDKHPVLYTQMQGKRQWKAEVESQTRVHIIVRTSRADKSRPKATPGGTCLRLDRSNNNDVSGVIGACHSLRAAMGQFPRRRAGRQSWPIGGGDARAEYCVGVRRLDR